MKLFATVTNDYNEWLPGVNFLRGGSVAVLMILRPSEAPNERFVIMTEQPRIAAGSLQFMEIPAGMIDNEDSFAGTAAREIKEEVGVELKGSDLMTKLAVKGHRASENLRSAIYPSPGGCDEFISIFLWENEMDRLQN
jgi:8-oxo-dGTP pyrophosphatase MutT (NUDIX family)